MFDKSSKHELQMERIVFFSDAVFAIAITLLVIDVKVPHLEHGTTTRDFLLALVQMLPSLIGYFFSFLVIGAYWVGHHRIYGLIVDWDYGLVWRNIYFLMCIAFMPFVTAMFSEYPTEFVPLALYAATLAIAGILQIVQLRYARQKGLVDPAASENVYPHLVWRASVIPMIALIAVVVALITRPIFAGLAFMVIPVIHRVLHAKFSTTVTSEDERE